MNFSYAGCNPERQTLQASFNLPIKTIYESHLVAPLEFFQALRYFSYTEYFNNPSLSLSFDQDPEMHEVWIDLQSADLDSYLCHPKHQNLIFLECEEVEETRLNRSSRPVLKMIPLDLNSIPVHNPSEYICYEATYDHVVPLKTRDLSTLHFSLRDYKGDILKGTSALSSSSGTARQTATVLTFKVHRL